MVTPCAAPPSAAPAFTLRYRSRSFDAGSSPETQPSLFATANESDFADNSSATSVDDDVVHRPLVPGVYAPTLAFFDRESEDIDHSTTAKHAVRLAKAGIVGLVTQGSSGEAVHLSHAERSTITRVTRRALDAAGYRPMPIIVGCGAQSTRETVELCRDAQAAGGDYAMVLPPSYYRTMFRSESLAQFFMDVADASPIPILLYNYPGAVSGVDLDSDAIIALSKHPNIVGCKLTCGNTGKLARVAAATAASTPTEPSAGFMCFGGSADFTLPTLIAGGSGIIAGLANVAPRACVEIVQLYAAGKVKKARRLQTIVARGDWIAIKRGIVASKSVLDVYYGYGGYGRKPLPRPTEAEIEQAAQEMKELLTLEKSLEKLQ